MRVGARAEVNSVKGLAEHNKGEGNVTVYGDRDMHNLFFSATMEGKKYETMSVARN